MTMAFDFDFSEEAKKTDEELRRDIKKLSPLTEAEINAMLPQREDKAHLMELIRLVNSAADKNKKVAQLSENMQKLGGVRLAVLAKYLKPV